MELLLIKSSINKIFKFAPITSTKLILGWPHIFDKWSPGAACADLHGKTTGQGCAGEK
jgi:hypothetical protein